MPLAKLIAGGKSRRHLAYFQSYGSKHLEGRDMQRIAIDNGANPDALSQVTNRLVLRVQVVNLPCGIVVKRKFRARQILLRTLGLFGKSFLGTANVIDNHSGPYPDICHYVHLFPRLNEPRSARERYEPAHY